jgi:hypothetical protein
MSTPSLLNIPYVIKAGTLYSQIPESGAGDFAVSRTTSPTTNRSTRVNANGFIELVNDNVPRLDYPLGGAVNGCASLLVEPSAQNFVIQSEAFNTAGVWNLTNATAPNTTATLDPFGNTNADIFTATAAFGRTQSNTLVAGATGNYTMSCFIKGIPGVAAVGSLVADRGVGFTITSGGVITVNNPVGYNAATSLSIQNYGNGWYRVFATWNYSAVNLTLLVASSVSGDSFYIFGAQLEAGSVPTSYIPTTTQAITRGADLINKTSIASLIGQSEGTIYMEVDYTQISSQAFRINSGVTNAIHIYKTNLGRYTINIYPSSGTITLGESISRTGFVKLAIAYKSGDSALVVNGATPITNAASFTFSTALSSVNFQGGVENVLPTYIRSLAVYPNRLSNTQLQALTTP